MVRSTFFGFTTALRGLNASQKGLDVTGQNISNFNTTGYTRQRVDLYSSASGYADMYATRPSTAVGQGADIGGISQLRDPFLDVRFRREACKLGEEDSKLDALNGLQAIFDETMSTGLDTQVSDFIKQLQSLSKNTGNTEFDGIAKASAEVLTKLFNQYAKQVGTVREQQQYQLENVDIAKINDTLKSIANLNQTIKENQLHGNPALELRDQRNLLIDELSTYIKIDVSYKPNEIAPGVIVDDVEISLMNDAGNANTLVKNSQFTEFKVGAGNTIIATPTKDAVTNAVNEINKLVNSLNTLNGKIGALDPTATDYAAKLAAFQTEQSGLTTKLKDYIPSMDTPTLTGTPPQMKITISGGSTDLLTNPPTLTFDATGKATILSGADDLTTKVSIFTNIAANSNDITANIITGSIKGSLDMLNKSGEFDTPPNTTRGIGYYEKTLNTIANKLATEFNKANALPDGTPHDLFGTNDGTTTITAKNLTIAKDWTDCKYGITATKNANPGGDNSGAADNILYMISLFSQKFDFKTPTNAGPPPTGGVSLFNGTFQQCVGNTINVLALDIKSTGQILKNYSTVLSGIDDSRSELSGVSLDEEGVNLLKFQKSYNAAARLMTTLDEAIDTVINKMGVVGR